MSPTTRELIPVSDLLFDLLNPRLKKEPPDQQAAIIAIAKHQGPRLLALARDIALHGMDPTTLTAVTPDRTRSGSGRRFSVLEGNRRLAAIKAAETPALVEDVFKGADRKRLHAIHDDFQENPTHDLECVVFESESEARRWIELRHTGPGKGEGLVQWGAEEKDRNRRRHGSSSPAGELIDLVREAGGLSKKAAASDRPVLTNLNRLLSTKEVRDALGLDRRSGVLYSHYPPEELLKGLTAVVEDLLTTVKVQHIYTKDQRVAYITKDVPRENLPDPVKRLEAPIEVRSIGSVDLTRKKRGGGPRDRSRDRSYVVPHDCYLEIPENRIHDIYTELKRLQLSQFKNAIAVVFRVFLELSVDDYVKKHKVPLPAKPSLAQKMKAAAKHLYTAKKLTKNEKLAVDQAANTKLGIASTFTFNQYVHNKNVYPDQDGLRDAWDQLQPFFVVLWPRTP